MLKNTNFFKKINSKERIFTISGQKYKKYIVNHNVGSSTRLSIPEELQDYTAKSLQLFSIISNEYRNFGIHVLQLTRKKYKTSHLLLLKYRDGKIILDYKPCQSSLKNIDCNLKSQVTLCKNKNKMII